jgi:hypothetical protein
MSNKIASDLERRFFCAEDLAIETREADSNKTVLRGHAAVFNQLSVDLGGFREQIAPGAFLDAINQDDIRALFNHDPNMILGRKQSGTLRLQEDSHGLLVELDIPDTNAGRDLITSIKRGDVNQMSFGFRVKPGGQDWAKDEEGRMIRTLKKVGLLDVSPVTFPAYPQTDIAVREMRSYLDAINQTNVEDTHKNKNKMLLKLKLAGRVLSTV